MQLAYLPRLLSASGSADMPQLVVSRAIVARGWGPLCFLYPFLQAWSQPGIKLFKSSRWASQLNSCTERTGCEIPRAPALVTSPQPSTKHTGPYWYPVLERRVPTFKPVTSQAPALPCKGIIKP